MKVKPDLLSQCQGSGAGIKQITEQAVDLGCTDAFLKNEHAAAAKAGWHAHAKRGHAKRS
jgi:ABC-type phosphate transport system substrate-binding protein